MSLVRWVGVGACALVVGVPGMALGQPEPTSATSSSSELLEKIRQANLEAAAKPPPPPPAPAAEAKPEEAAPARARTKSIARPAIDLHDPWGAATPPVARGFAPSPARKALMIESGDPWGS